MQHTLPKTRPDKVIDNALISETDHDQEAKDLAEETKSDGSVEPVTVPGVDEDDGPNAAMSAKETHQTSISAHLLPATNEKQCQLTAP